MEGGMDDTRIKRMEGPYNEDKVTKASAGIGLSTQE